MMEYSSRPLVVLRWGWVLSAVLLLLTGLLWSILSPTVPYIGPLRVSDTHFSVATTSNGDLAIYSSDQSLVFLAHPGDFSPRLDATRFHTNTSLTFVARAETSSVDETVAGAQITQVHTIEQIILYDARNVPLATYTANDYNAAGSSTNGRGLLPLTLIVLGLLLTGLALLVERKRPQAQPVPNQPAPRPTRSQQKSVPPDARQIAAPTQRERPPVPPPVITLPPPRQETPLRNERWLGLAESCATLFDDLDAQMPGLDAPRQQVVRHVENRLREILIHSGVEVIARDRVFDERRHQLDEAEDEVAPGTPIAAFISPGFAVEDRVLRRAIVRTTSAERA